MVFNPSPRHTVGVFFLLCQALNGSSAHHSAETEVPPITSALLLFCLQCDSARCFRLCLEMRSHHLVF